MFSCVPKRLNPIFARVRESKSRISFYLSFDFNFVLKLTHEKDKSIFVFRSNNDLLNILIKIQPHSIDFRFFFWQEIMITRVLHEVNSFFSRFLYILKLKQLNKYPVIIAANQLIQWIDPFVMVKTRKNNRHTHESGILIYTCAMCVFNAAFHWYAQADIHRQRRRGRERERSKPIPIISCSYGHCASMRSRSW